MSRQVIRIMSLQMEGLLVLCCELGAQGLGKEGEDFLDLSRITCGPVLDDL